MRWTIGPEPAPVEDVAATLSTLWQVAYEFPRRYDANLLVVTEDAHAARVLEALGALPWDAAGRQVIVVLGAHGPARVSLEPGDGRYVERVVAPGTLDTLDRLAEALLRPAPVTRVWWARDRPPPAAVLARLAKRAGQFIADTRGVDRAALGDCAPMDLAWARTARWRALLEEVLDSPAVATHLADFSHATVRFAPPDERPAKLFAAWLALRLGWASLARVHFVAAAKPREPGDLSGVEAVGAGVLIEAEAHGGEARLSVTANGRARAFTRPLAPLTLGQGLAELLRRPPRDAEYERAEGLLDGAPREAPS